jgi:hypothetical protein
MTDYCPPDPLTILPVYNPENWIDTCSGGGGGGGAGFQGPQGILGISGNVGAQGTQGISGGAGGAGTQGPQGVAGGGSLPFISTFLNTNLANNTILFNGTNPPIPWQLTFPFNITVARGIFAPSGQTFVAFQFMDFSGNPITTGYASRPNNVIHTTTCGTLTDDFTVAFNATVQGSITVSKLSNGNEFNVEIVWRHVQANRDTTNSFWFNTGALIWGIRYGTFNSITGFGLDLGGGGAPPSQMNYAGSVSIVPNF